MATDKLLNWLPPEPPLHGSEDNEEGEMNYWKSKRAEALAKFNPYHDKATGRFTNAEGGSGAGAPAEGLDMVVALDHLVDYEMVAQPEGWDIEKPVANPAHENAVQVAAKQLVDAAESAEPRVSGELSGIADQSGAEMIGLDFAVKGMTSLARKIRDRLVMKREITSMHMAKAEIKDSLRYTMGWSHTQYSEGVEVAFDQLHEAGWRAAPGEKGEDYWHLEDDYMGFNMNWTSPEGIVTEIQFHTQGSFRTKESNHPVFEEFKASGYTDLEAWDAMVTAWDDIPRPQGWPPTTFLEKYSDIYQTAQHRPPKGR